MLKKIESSNAPKTLGPYSQAIKAGGMIFFSGQLGIDPATDQLKDGIEEQLHQALSNLQAVAEAAGCTLKDVVRCDIFLVNLNDFAKVNAIYEKFFSSSPQPARQTVGVAALPRNALVEISCIAIIPDLP